MECLYMAPFIPVVMEMRTSLVYLHDQGLGHGICHGSM